MIYLLLAACSPVTLYLYDGPPDASGPVTDTASDTGATGDTAPDTGGDSGKDTGDLPSDAGEYVGTVSGLYTSYGGSTYDCDGSVDVTLRPGGALSGEATCAYGGGTDYDLDGEIAGTVVDGVVTATWTVHYWSSDYDYDLTGHVADGEMQISLSADYGDGTAFTADMSATR